ncbi:MAG: hypothetical protein J7J88_02400 [Dehalococcoidia bacterium]|nr:hypothetical protein [Dehalococcoidia bacterium]
MGNRTWKPTTAGILSIVAGGGGVVWGIAVAVGGSLSVGVPLGVAGMHNFFIVTVILVLLGAMAIVGGIYALQRRNWGLALAGSICSLFCLWFVGIPAIIFTVMGKEEFN